MGGKGTKGIYKNGFVQTHIHWQVQYCNGQKNGESDRIFLFLNNRQINLFMSYIIVCQFYIPSYFHGEIHIFTGMQTIFSATTSTSFTGTPTRSLRPRSSDSWQNANASCESLTRDARLDMRWILKQKNIGSIGSIGVSYING